MIKRFFQKNPTIFVIVRFLAMVLGFGIGVGVSDFILMENFIIIEIILILIVLIFWFFIPAIALFVAYCPHCKWVPTTRIFGAMFFRWRPFTHYCRKCEKRGVEIKCY